MPWSPGAPDFGAMEWTMRRAAFIEKNRVATMHVWLASIFAGRIHQ
jgi:hypothetical protein